MKKLLLTTFVMTAMGAAAHAGTISMDARADYESNTYNDAANKRNSTRFNLQTVRLDAKGNMNESTSYRIRYRLNNPSSGVNGSTAAPTYRLTDSASKALDFAYIEHKLMDNLSLQMGKFTTDIGGIEGLTTGPDLYFTSVAYGEQNPLRYATGAKLMYIMESNEFDVMAFNQETDAIATNPDNTTTSFAQNHQAYGVVWKGSFMDKSLSPVLSWHNDNMQPSATGACPAAGAASSAACSQENNFYSAGLKWDWSPFFVEADYLYDTFKDKSVVGETDKTSSAVVTLGARMEQWVGKLKYENSEAEVFSAGAGSRKDHYQGYQAAVEYLPSNEKYFRYHVAYISRDVKPDKTGTAGDTQNTQTVLVGTRILADFLK